MSIQLFTLPLCSQPLVLESLLRLTRQALHFKETVGVPFQPQALVSHSLAGYFFFLSSVSFIVTLHAANYRPAPRAKSQKGIGWSPFLSPKTSQAIATEVLYATA
ncbi:MAG: hypothetical protein ABIQ47_04205 [Tepidiformaceae bacterium]